MAAALVDIGVISDKSTNLQASDGEVLEAKATGGVLVGREEGEPVVTLTTRVKEPDFKLDGALLESTEDEANEELQIKSLVVKDEYSVKLTPKNVGALGIRARKTQVSYRPGYSEDEGHYVDLTFTLLTCADGELYTKFRKKAGAPTP